MRRLLAGGLTLTAGLWLASARGGDLPTAAAADAELPAVTLGRPTALEAPVVRTSTVAPVSDQNLRPAAFIMPALGRAEPLVRAQSPDAVKPMPAGPSLDSVNTTDTQTAPPPVAQKLGAPRLMPSASGTSNASPVSDNCGSVDDCCVSDGGCCWWRPFACLFAPGNCVSTPPYFMWVNAEYLAWGFKTSNYPALVTSSPAGTPRTEAGVLGTNGVRTLFGDSAQNDHLHSGGRLTLGFWFDQEQTWGLEGSGFWLADGSTTFSASSPGLPILARPFFDVVAMAPASELVAFPGVVSGNIMVKSNTSFYGANIDLRTNLWRGCCWKFDLLGGVRYLGLDDSLNVTESLVTGPAGGAFAGSGILVHDMFGTHNVFWGGELGTEFEFRRGAWSFGLLGKVALGGTHETVNINGSTTFAVPMAAPTVQMGGLLALPGTNIGHYTTNRFAVSPEIGVKIGYQVTDWMKVTLGYSLIYISDVARPGNQIDTTVNPSRLPTLLGPGMPVGPPRPAFTFKSTDFWAQGMNLGLEFRF